MSYRAEAQPETRHVSLIKGMAADVLRYRRIGDVVLEDQAMRQLENYAGERVDGKWELNAIARAALGEVSS